MKDLIHFLSTIKPNEIDKNSYFKKLSGDASNRKFYRINWDDEHSYILMVYPEQFNKDNFPYLIQYNLFKDLNLPIAQIYYVNEKNGWILLDDLGDDTLQSHINICNKNEIIKLYKKAIELLFKLQTIDNDTILRHNKAFTLVFDTQKLYDELIFCYEHFFQRMVNIRFSKLEDSIIKKGFYCIANYLSNRRRVLAHRDYHSRNIMIKNGDIYLIDFQDARMGPRSYDLISLVRDSYVEITNDMRVELIKFFESELGKIEEKEIIYMSIQRNLKAIGTFSYQYCVKSNNTYIEFIPRTINYIIENLSLLDDINEFRLVMDDAIKGAREKLLRKLGDRKNDILLH